MSCVSCSNYLKCRYSVFMFKSHITNHGKFYRIEIPSACRMYSTHSPPTENHKCDVIGLPHSVSNLRPLHFHIPENEAPIERQFRLKRQEVQQWNQEFWTNHNARFIQPKLNKVSSIKTISHPIGKVKSTISTRSAPDNLKQGDRDRLREESFQAWVLLKQQQQIEKQKEDEEMKKILAEEKEMRRETAELSYLLWKHKKDQQKKANEAKERQVKEDQERKKTLKQQVSKERVDQWLSSARYKPRPVRSNMGLLSMSSNPPTFFNPRPWVDPV